MWTLKREYGDRCSEITGSNRGDGDCVRNDQNTPRKQGGSGRSLKPEDPEIIIVNETIHD
jgi:hypothetical protein